MKIFYSLHLFYYFKGSIFLKNRYFIIQERFNKLIYCISSIIKCGIWQTVKCQLIFPFLKWNDFLSYLWITVANINSQIRSKIISFRSSSKTRDWLKFYRLSDATFYDIINKLNLSWIKKWCIFLGIWSFKFKWSTLDTCLIANFQTTKRNGRSCDM